MGRTNARSASTALALDVPKERRKFKTFDMDVDARMRRSVICRKEARR